MLGSSCCALIVSSLDQDKCTSVTATPVILVSSKFHSGIRGVDVQGNRERVSALLWSLPGRCLTTNSYPCKVSTHRARRFRLLQAPLALATKSNFGGRSQPRRPYQQIWPPMVNCPYNGQTLLLGRGVVFTAAVSVRLA